MLRWLKVLGPLKWPSILLVLSPIAAYPFWAEQPRPMHSCGPVSWRGQVYEAYTAPGADDVLLRPSSRNVPGDRRLPSALPDDIQPVRYDPGAVVFAMPTGLPCGLGGPAVSRQR